MGAEGAAMLVARAQRTHVGLGVGGVATASSGNLGVAKDL